MPLPDSIHHPLRPSVAPVEYAGEWVAWNKQRTEIVAHGKKLYDVHEAAVAAGHPNAVLQKVRRPDSISADGSVVAFTSAANNLAPGDTNEEHFDVFVRDLSSGTTQLVSVAMNGVKKNGNGAEIVVQNHQ